VSIRHVGQLVTLEAAGHSFRGRILAFVPRSTSLRAALPAGHGTIRAKAVDLASEDRYIVKRLWSPPPEVRMRPHHIDESRTGRLYTPDAGTVRAALSR